MIPSKNVQHRKINYRKQNQKATTSHKMYGRTGRTQKIRLNQSAKEIKNLSLENDKLNKSLKEEKDKIKKLKKSLNYYKDKAGRHIKDLIVDKDQEIELLQEQWKELKLEKDGLQALLDISESDMVTTFENRRMSMVSERFTSSFWV